MFKTIVVAVDGSASSDKALALAADLAREFGGRVVAVHVKELMAGRFPGPVHVDEGEVLARIRTQVKALGDAGIAFDLEVHTSMAGGPAHVVAETAERVEADVIVSGTRGHTALAGVVLGSVAQRLLHVAPCPVLIVRESARSQPEPDAEREGVAAR